MKKIIWGILLTMLVLAGGYYLFTFFQKPKWVSITDNSTTTEVLAPEIEAVISKKIKTINELAANPALIQALIDANLADANLTEDQIHEADSAWILSKGNTDLSRQASNSKSSLILQKFIATNPGYPEIFVTDNRGLNVGQTNITSDYLQADESWWVDAYAGGVGKSYHGKIQFDESSQSRSISLYAPVYDTNHKVLGVIKAVLDIKAIEQAL